MSVPVQDVVRAEWNDVPGGQNVVRAALHHAPHVKVVCIEKGSDGDTQKLFAAELLFDCFCKKLFGEFFR